VRLADIDAAGDAAPSSIVEVRRFVDAAGRDRVALAVRSDLPIEEQLHSRGATWLDRQLVARERVLLGSSGFGREVHDAMEARVEHLIGQGLARRQGQQVFFVRDLLGTLRQGELDATAARLASNMGRPYHPAVKGEFVSGTYHQRVDIASGRFAMIDNGLGFSLVPWSPSLERYFGRDVSGVLHANRVSWSFGRESGPTVGW
jgi:hypothetical protein